MVKFIAISYSMPDLDGTRITKDALEKASGHKIIPLSLGFQGKIGRVEESKCIGDCLVSYGTMDTENPFSLAQLGVALGFTRDLETGDIEITELALTSQPSCPNTGIFMLPESGIKG